MKNSSGISRRRFLKRTAVTGAAAGAQIIEWDVEKMQCTNLPEINQDIRREYRKGWEV